MPPSRGPIILKACSQLIQTFFDTLPYLFCNNSFISAFTYIVFGRVLRKLLAKFAFFSDRFSLFNAAFRLLSGWMKDGLKGFVAIEQYKSTEVG